MYACGDTVVYRHHVCEVAALRENYFEGKDYLELRALFENSLKLFVAVDEATPDNLRPIMSKRAALALIDSIVDAAYAYFPEDQKIIFIFPNFHKENADQNTRIRLIYSSQIAVNDESYVLYEAVRE